MLYREDMKFALGFLDEKERVNAWSLFIKWFLNEEVPEPENSNVLRVFSALKEKQVEAVSRYIRGLEMNSEKAKLRESRKKEKLQGIG